MSTKHMLITSCGVLPRKKNLPNQGLSERERVCLKCEPITGLGY